jgi:hypothetical protein
VAVGEVVAVAQKRDPDAARIRVGFLDGLVVREQLHGVQGVAEPVDDGDGGMPGEFDERGLFVHAAHHAVHPAFEVAGDVADAFADPEPDLGVGEGDGVPAELVHADVEGGAGAQAGLLEDEREGEAREGLRAAPLAAFHGVGGVEDGAEFLWAEVEARQKIPSAQDGGGKGGRGLRHRE